MLKKYFNLPYIFLIPEYLLERYIDYVNEYYKFDIYMPSDNVYFIFIYRIFYQHIYMILNLLFQFIKVQ